MTKPPGVLIWFSVTLHLVRGVREMGKHTLISLSAKWYVFLCNPYLEGEGLCLSTSWRLSGFWESCGLTLSIVSGGRIFPTWLLTMAPNILFLCSEKSVCHGTSSRHCPWTCIIHSTEGRGEGSSSERPDSDQLYSSGTLTPNSEPSLKKIMTLTLNSVESKYPSLALLRPGAGLCNKITT